MTSQKRKPSGKKSGRLIRCCTASESESSFPYLITPSCEKDITTPSLTISAATARRGVLYVICVIKETLPLRLTSVNRIIRKMNHENQYSDEFFDLFASSRFVIPDLIGNPESF